MNRQAWGPNQRLTPKLQKNNDQDEQKHINRQNPCKYGLCCANIDVTLLF